MGTVKSLQCAESPNDRLLNQVLGVGGVPGQGPSHPQQHHQLRLDMGAERERTRWVGAA